MSDGLILKCDCLSGMQQAEPSHYRAYTMLYFSSGEHEVIINDTSFIAPPHSLVFVNHLEEFLAKPLSNQCNHQIVQLAFDSIGRYTAYPELLSIFRNRPVGFIPHVPATDHTADIFAGFYQEFTHLDYFSNDLIWSGLRRQLVELFRRNKEDFPNPIAHLSPQVEAVRLNMEKNFYKGLVISDMAEQFELSLYYLCHAFKALTGYSPKHFILANQLSLAKELLLTTNLSITDISLQCGFPNLNSFTRNFSMQLHTSPREYRKLKRNTA